MEQYLNQIWVFLKNYKLAILIVCIYLIVSLVGIYYTPLFDEDEGFFAEASRHMIINHDYVNISVNGETRYDKPALYFWIVAASLKIFGMNELGARFPSFVIFIFSVIAVYRFALRNFNLSVAKLSAVIAFSIVQFQVLSKANVSDNLLNLLVTLALFRFYEFTQKSNKLDLFWLYTLAGLGFLTKGPISFVIIFGVIFFYYLLTKKVKSVFKIFNPFLLIWSLSIPLPWFYAAYKQSGDFLFTDFILTHNLGRFTNTMESHGGHFYYYIPTLILAFVPFIHLFPSVFKNVFKSDLNKFLAVWFVLPFVLFSFSKTQLPHYISIGYFPLILLMGQAKINVSKGLFYQILAMMALFLSAPIIAPHLKIDDVYFNEMITDISMVFVRKYYVVMSFLLLVIGLIYYYASEKYALLSLVFCVACTLFINRYSQLQQGFVKEIGLSYRNKPPTNVVMEDHYNPSLSFYANHVFPIVSESQTGQWVFCRAHENNQISDLDVVISKGSGYLLFGKFVENAKSEPLIHFAGKED